MLGDTTFLVFAKSGGLAGVYSTFYYQGSDNQFPSNPEILDVATGTNGDRWDMYVHSYNETTRQYKIFQSYWDYGFRLWSIYGEDADPFLPTGDGSIDSNGSAPGPGPSPTPSVDTTTLGGPGGSPGFGKNSGFGNSRGGPFGSIKRK